MGFVYRDDFLDCDCLPDCQIPWTRISFPKEIRLCASLRARFDFSLIFQGRKLKLNFDNHSGRKPRVNQINFQLNNHVEEEKWSYNTYFLSQSNVAIIYFHFLEWVVVLVSLEQVVNTSSSWSIFFAHLMLGEDRVRSSAYCSNLANVLSA